MSRNNPNKWTDEQKAQQKAELSKKYPHGYVILPGGIYNAKPDPDSKKSQKKAVK